MRKTLFFLILVFTSLPALAQEGVTESAEDRYKRMLEAGMLPEGVTTSFHRRTVDSHEAPWRAIGRVNIGGRAHCSGSLVAPDVVLTAAHCVFSQTEQKMVVPSIVHFLAGYQQGEYLAHSKVVSYEVSPSFDGTKGPSADTVQYDWAFLKLEDAIGADLGHLPFPANLHMEPSLLVPGTEVPRAELATPMVTVAGYPGDRAHILSLEEGCRIRAMAKQGHVLVTDCVSIHGDSGAPILQTGPEGWHIIGIQTAGTKIKGHAASMGVTVLAFWPTFLSLADTAASN